MNILYLHGLDSSLSDKKRQILIRYGKVFAPKIDYRKNKNSISQLVSEFRNKNIDIVIGSSMGGFVGYHLSDALQKPALLFNPALAQRSISQEILEYNNTEPNFKRIVIGAQDEVVDPAETMKFLAETLSTRINYEIHFRTDLAHRIPIPIFEEEVKLFFDRL